MQLFFLASMLFAEIYTELIPSIYCIILLIFLFPLFMIITFQLIQIINIENQFNRLSQKNLAGNLTYDDTFVLVKIYAKKKLWLSSIKVLESSCVDDLDAKCKYCNIIGFSYYSMKQYDLAKSYYLKALNLRKDYLTALQNLAKIYELTKEFSLALETYHTVLLYYPHNSVAVRNIERIKNRDSRI
uniref:hypothetical protein n=1 Tax=Lithothamnion corallioides TaxID=1277934 RepID=UPI0023F108F9|nr:hypothetical protein P6G75_pgp117 [Lithothamnion corallioides]WEA77123.1 hypothetical protein [Lithothamnion corallioides]